MPTRTLGKASSPAEIAGFAILDDRGRVALSKAARQALNLHAGSALAYAVVDGTILLFPQDQHLAETATRAASILERAGLTIDDLLTELPAVREEVLRDSYGDAFVDEVERRHAESRGPSGARLR
jgi:bifunctional DNA-binding transcriptional regulator/antitoxin component of YhaV-PrlF toxin-antitoxin module